MMETKSHDSNKRCKNVLQIRKYRSLKHGNINLLKNYNEASDGFHLKKFKHLQHYHLNQHDKSLIS